MTLLWLNLLRNCDTINALAEQSNGFVWRLKSDAGNATDYNPYHDERIIVNFSVWQNVDDQKNFVYKSAHTDSNEGPEEMV